MKPKKESAEWYIAGTHWLTAMITGIIGGILLLILAAFTGNPVLVAIMGLVAWPFMVWLGVIYSARYLNKTYVIKNAKHIVLLSTIYLVIVAGGFRLYEFVQTGVVKMEYIGFVVGVIIFYIASKKYVKDNASTENSMSSI